MTLYDAVMSVILPLIDNAKNNATRLPEELIIISQNSASIKNPKSKTGEVTIETSQEYDTGTQVVGVPIGNNKYFVVGRII